MKRSLCLFACTVSLLSDSLARATGGTHTQSVMMCGHVFDVYWQNDPNGRPMGKCFSASLSGSKTFPLQPGDTVNIRGVTLSGCQDPPSPHGERWLYQTCNISPTGICGGTDKAYLLPIKHEWNADFSVDKRQVMAACVPPDPKPPPPPPLGPAPLPPANPTSPDEQAGAIGKCIHEGWFGFPPKENDATSVALFKACTRMARADYSGKGDTDTHIGIWVEVGTRSMEESNGATCNLNDGCFEATWNEEGSVCLSRKRKERIATAVHNTTLDLLEILANSTDKNERALIEKRIKARAQWLRRLFDDELKFYKGIANGEFVAAARPGACRPAGNKAGLIYNRSRRDLDGQACDASDYDIRKCKQGQDCLQWDPRVPCR